MAVMMIVMVAMLMIGAHHGSDGRHPQPPAPDKAAVQPADAPNDVPQKAWRH